MQLITVCANGNVIAFRVSLLSLFLVFAIFSNLISQDFFGATLGPTGRNDIQSIAFNGQDDIFAGTFGNGVLVSTNNGISWEARNTGLNCLHVKVVYPVQNGAMLAGTYGGGIYISTNGGVSWLEKNNGLTNLFVKALTIGKTGHIYAGTYGGGVFVSTNNGNNWKPINKGLQFRDISALTVTIDSTILAGTWGGGIYRLKHNTENWLYGSTGVQIKYFNGFCHDSVGHVYAASNGEGILMSVSNGMEWSAIKYLPSDKNITSILINAKEELITGSRVSGVWRFDSRISGEWEKTNLRQVGISAIARNSKNMLFAFAPTEGFYSSTNNGVTWQYRSMHEPYAPTVIECGKNGLMFSSLYGKTLWLSKDYGRNWEKITSLQQDTIRSLCIDSAGNIWAGTIKGLYKSTDKGGSWSNVPVLGMDANKLVIEKMICRNDGMILINGILDLGRSAQTFIAKSTDFGDNWTNTGDIAFPVFDFAVHPNGDIFYASGGVFRSTNNGDSYSELNISIFSAYTIDISSTGVIFVGKSDGLFYSRDTCNTWVRDTFDIPYPEKPAIAQILCTRENEIFTEVRYYKNIYRAKIADMEYDSLDRSFSVTNFSHLAANNESDVFYATGCLHRAINPKTMKPPEVISPNDITRSFPLNPEFNWKSTIKADLYHLQVSDSPEFDYIMEWVIQSDTAYMMIKTLAYNKTYYYRIRSKTNSAYSAWSKIYLFTTTMAPPELISPENLANGIHIPTFLLWHKSSGAERYQCQVAKSNDFSDIVFDAIVNDTSVFADGTDYLKDYYWRVKAINNAGASDWSEMRKFTATLPPPALLYPLNNASEVFPRLTFNWRKVPTGVNYQIQIAKNGSFDQIIYDSETSADTTHFMELLEYDNTYWWRVRSKRDNIIGAWSEIWSFTTAIAPIIQRAPANDSINVPLSVWFSWEQSPKAEKYHLQISTDSEFKAIIFDNAQITSSEWQYSAPERFKYYFWRVREVRGDRRGLWSSIWRFRTVMDKPSLNAPENNSTDVKRTLYLYWHFLNGAEYYLLQVAKDPFFTNSLMEFDSLTLNQQDIYELEYDTKYYWRALAYRSDYRSEWSDVWNFTTERTTGVFNNGNDFSFQVFPNPASQFINIEYYLNEDSQLRISIISNNGKEFLLQNATYKQAGRHTDSFDVTELASGVYFIRISDGSKISLRKFIKAEK